MGDTTSTPGPASYFPEERSYGPRQPKFSSALRLVSESERPGPCDYAPSVMLNMEALKGNSFDRSKRWSQKGPALTPGPTSYQPVQPLDDGASKRGLSAFISAGPRWGVHGREGPGPGDYSTSTVMQGRTPQLSFQRSKRWNHPASEEMSGPALYYETPGQVAIANRCAPGQPKFSDVPRIRSEPRLGPGPGEYMPNQLKAMDRGSFPLTRRFSSRPSAEVDTTPGPGAYWSTVRQQCSGFGSGAGQPRWTNVPRTFESSARPPRLELNIHGNAARGMDSTRPRGAVAEAEEDK